MTRWYPANSGSRFVALRLQLTHNLRQTEVSEVLSEIFEEGHTMLDRSRTMKLVVFGSMLITLVLAVSLAAASAQYKSSRGSGQQKMSQTVGQPALTASLIDAEKNAKEKSATVEVRVTGVKLIDPALTNKRPTKGEGHLHYQVDSGPVIATTTPKLSFHELTPGKHKIVVMLANNDHTPAGPQQTLEITVP